MQLLDSEQLEYAFALHGVNREGEARQFYADLWRLIKKAEKASDPPSRNRCELELRSLCTKYFALMNLWRLEEEDSSDPLSPCLHSIENARAAKALLPAFEKQFFRYCLCYMDLNRALIHFKAQISHLAKDRDIASADIMQINRSTGPMLSRTHTQRLELLEKRLRLDRAESILMQTDKLMEYLGQQLPRIFGNNEGDHQITRFKAALRQKKFDLAREVASAWNIKPTQAALRIIDSIERHADELGADGGILLHSGELSLVRKFLASDEDKVNQMLEKFNIPYMVYQYKNLLHQGYLLGRIGSLEGLIVQHAKLISLSVRVHADPAHAQLQEQTILLPATALIQGHFRTLGSIFDETDSIVSILEKMIGQTREYLAHIPVQ